MSIIFVPLNRREESYQKVADLYNQAFPTKVRVPLWLLLYKTKVGFETIYDNDNWIGLIYTTEYKDIVFVHFFAIAEARRSGGYGSKVMGALKARCSGKRIVLNIEEIDEQSENYKQQVKRKKFYENNGYVFSGYIVEEQGERFEMMIVGGSISKSEIEAFYRKMIGRVLSLFFRPKIIEA